MEICGALVGQWADGRTVVTGAIAGDGASQGGAHVTFTQEAWVTIHDERERRFPGQIIVGWYHSHPGFGVFLSDHDTFIHKNFFPDPGQLAWVYDPHSDEEGCFGWKAGEVERLDRIEVLSDIVNEPTDRAKPPVHREAPRHLPHHRLGPMLRKLCKALFLLLVGAVLGGLGVIGWQQLSRSQSRHPAEDGIVVGANRVQSSEGHHPVTRRPPLEGQGGQPGSSRRIS